MRLAYFERPMQNLVRGLSIRDLLPLGAAIFLLFSVIGPIRDLLAGASQPQFVVIRTALFSGLIALGYAFGTMRRNYPVLALSVAVQVLWIASGGRLSGTAPAGHPDVLPGRLAFDAVATLGAMVSSYVCFLWFMNATAGRYLRVTAEMEVARQIHQGLVPAVAATSGDFEFGGRSIPSGEVGGDLVDVVHQDGRWFGYVADVSGHGVSSGVVMGMFKSALRMRLLQPGPLSALLADLNQVLFPLTSSSMFVTVACVRGGTDDTLEFAVAGHLPILRVGGASRTVEEYTTPQIPVGMFEDYRFTSATLPCERGDLLALITDGLTEVFDEKDEQFGLDAVKAILASLADRPLGEISEAIVAAARAFGKQLDDQTLLLIRRR